MREAKRWRALSVDEIDPVDWRDTGLAWRPVRHALGAGIVGISAFTVERAGEIVVEAHNETRDSRGHQEIYLVLRGHAQFVIDGTRIDAPQGTIIRVDPDADREATAQESETTVLALGGDPTFRPSPSEWIERARPLLRSDPEQAREIIDNLRQALPDNAGIEIGEALLAVGKGDTDTARQHVHEFLRKLPSHEDAIREDPDLASLGLV